MSLQSDYLDTARSEFSTWRTAIRHVVETLPEEALHDRFEGTNSIAILVQHLHGSHSRRWSEPFSSKPTGNPGDFRKDWEDGKLSRAELLLLHDEGWNRVFAVLAGLDSADLERKLDVRGAERPWLHGLIYHLSHYSYHYGQIVALAKIATRGAWNTAQVKEAAQIKQSARA